MRQILISIGARSNAAGNSPANHSRFAFGSALWALSIQAGTKGPVLQAKRRLGFVTWVTARTNPRGPHSSLPEPLQERGMSNELHELSTGDLEEFSGGIYRNFTPGPSITPS